MSSAAPMGPGGLMWSPIEPTAAGVPRLRGGVEVGEGAVITSPKDIPYGESRIVVRWTRFAGDAEKATANGSRLCAVQRTGRS